MMRGTMDQYVVPQARIAETIDHLSTEDRRILIKDVSTYGHKIIGMDCLSQFYKSIISNGSDLAFVALYLLKKSQPGDHHIKSLAKVASSLNDDNTVLEVTDIYSRLVSNGNGARKNGR